MTKVLLINSNTEIFPYPVAPLGISLVAASLESGCDVKIFDAAFHSSEDLLIVIDDYKPHYIGVSLRNIDNVTMRKCKWYLGEIQSKIINPVKNRFNIPIIVGGSGFSIAPKEIFDFLDVDYGVVGEGEEIFPKLIAMLESGEQIKLDNIISKQIHLNIVPQPKSMELKLPHATIDRFINFDSYKKRGSYPVQTKRGCSHQCIYCSYPNIEGRKYRLRPVADIIDEIQDTQTRIPDVTFEFVDSTFNSPLKHAIDICNEIIRRNLKVKLRTMGINPGEVTDDLIQLMKRAGFTQIDCTPDSASERMIKNYRKNFSKNRLIKCAQIIRKHDMPTMWFFMLGGPGETEESILETFEFIDSYVFEEDMVHITEGIRIIPQTKLFEIATKEGVISKNDSVIDPMFYVSPGLGKEKLTQLLVREISKRNNVLNSIDTTPSPELMQAAIQYRMENKVEEPMFRTLLRIQNLLKI